MNSTSPPDITTMAGINQLISELSPLIPTYTHLLISALFPIFAGAHASLSRPSTAAKSPEKDKRQQTSLDDDEEPVVQKMEGMSKTDALTFPLLAGVTLTGLYFLIKWLEDPATLNMILNWYFASFSVFATGRLVSDGLDVLHSLAFPRQYLDNGMLWEVRPLERVAVPISSPSNQQPPRNTPLPGPFAHLPLPQLAFNVLWFLKTAPNRKFTCKLHITKLITSELKLGIHGIEGLFIAVLTVLYYNLISKPWPLTNLFGFSFAYTALQLMSPTTFTIGTLLLSALFVYDVVMVFYTPMMVIVATKLEIPAKLEFPRPGVEGKKGGLAMLGLGDIVLPGIFVGLALRFDLWVWYLRRQREVVGGGETSSPSGVVGVTGNSTGEAKKKSKVEEDAKKAPYVTATGHWGTSLWTSPLGSLLSLQIPTSLSTNATAASTSNTQPWRFPKTYFTATMIGYIAGMITTLLAMQISDHPQPALLYLVPGVVGSLWSTAWRRGELKLLLEFTEADEEEEKKEEKGKEGGKGDEKGGEKNETHGRSELRWGGSNEDEAAKTKDGEETDTASEKKVEAKKEEPDNSRPFLHLRIPRVLDVEIRLPPALPNMTEEPQKKEQ